MALHELPIVWLTEKWQYFRVWNKNMHSQFCGVTLMEIFRRKKNRHIISQPAIVTNGLCFHSIYHEYATQNVYSSLNCIPNKMEVKSKCCYCFNLFAFGSGIPDSNAIHYSDFFFPHYLHILYRTNDACTIIGAVDKYVTFYIIK